MQMFHNIITKKGKQLTPKEKIVTFIQKSSIGAKATE